MAKNNSWERREKESPQAYGAFSIYRDMGAERSYAKVAQQLCKSKTIVNRWGSIWNWADRVRDWDNEIAAKVKEGVEKTATEMAQRHLKMASMLQTKAVTALSQMSVDDLTARDIVALMKQGVDMERLNRGEPTEVTEGRNTVSGRMIVENDPYAELSVEQLKALAKYAAEQSD